MPIFLLLLLWIIFPVSNSNAQFLEENSAFEPATNSLSSLDEEPNTAQEVPDPREVMLKSVRLPGWGQVVNEQIWKVPIVYGLIGGVAYFSYYTHQQYRDYRAAAYNAVEEHDDEKYGPTPPHIPEGQSLSALQNQRNIYRNRRDLSFLLIVAAYGLNVVDAYVFAHMRDFDVSEDLSANFDLEPTVTPSGNASLQLSFRLNF